MFKKLLITTLFLCCIMLLLAGCGGSGSSGDGTENTETAIAETETTVTEETTVDQSGETVRKEIDDVDDDLGMNLPLGLDSILLLEDGTMIIETDDALEDAVGEEVTIASDVQDVFVLPFGNGGYRSVLFIKADGSVSALSTDALINDHNIEVMDNLGGYTEVKSIESVQDPGGSLVNVVLENGDTFLLDPYLK